MAEQNTLKDIADIPGVDTRPSSGPNPETDAALEKLLLESGEKPEETSEATETKPEGKTETVPETKTEETTPEVKPEVTPEVKPETAAAAPVVTDDFDKVELPPHTKPKTGEAFETVKRLARERVSALEKEQETLRNKLKEIEEKGTGKVDPATAKELAELRKFRSQMDVEADPAFQSYDQKAKQNVDSIFSKLEEVKVPKENIDKVREIGVDNVDWDAVKMTPQLRRFIESKLAANLEIADQKKAALAEAKKNSEEYLKTRRETFEKKAVDESKAVENEINTLAAEFAWMSKKEAKSGASADEAKAIEAHNKLAADIKSMMTEAVEDPSPRMRALLAIGTAQFVALRTQSAREKADFEAKIAAITKERDDAKALVEKIKANSTTRLRDTSAITPTNEKPRNELDERAGDALDRIAREIGAVAK